MRVLPAAGKTAPRRPFLKSYAFFICSPFCWIRPAYRENTNRVATRRPDNYQASSKDVGSDRHPSRFSLDGFVFNRDRKRIAQDTVRIGERHAMLAKV